MNSRLVIYQSGGVGRAPSVVNFNGVLWFLIKSVMLLANMQSTTSLASNYWETQGESSAIHHSIQFPEITRENLFLAHSFSPLSLSLSTLRHSRDVTSESVLKTAFKAHALFLMKENICTFFYVLVTDLFQSEVKTRTFGFGLLEQIGVFLHTSGKSKDTYVNSVKRHLFALRTNTACFVHMINNTQQVRTEQRYS